MNNPLKFNMRIVYDVPMWRILDQREVNVSLIISVSIGAKGEF